MLVEEIDRAGMRIFRGYDISEAKGTRILDPSGEFGGIKGVVLIQTFMSDYAAGLKKVCASSVM
jgi:hypothetical protein